MSLLNFLRRKKLNTAILAKERLQIIVAEHRGSGAAPHYLLPLKKDILAVLSKYMIVDPAHVIVQLEQKENSPCAVLELNVPLPKSAGQLTAAQLNAVS